MSQSLNNYSDYSEKTIEEPSFTAESMITMTILSFTFILGLPGNAMVIWVTGLKMKRTVNTVWFLNLAVADFLCCLSLPFSIAQVALHGHWYYGGFLCKVIPSAIIFNMFASVFILVAISMDRCLLVIKPVWSQNHRTVYLASWMCVGIWFLAFLMCIPVFVYRNTITSYEGKIACGYDYLSDSDYFTVDPYYDTTDYAFLPIMTSEQTANRSEEIINHTMLNMFTASTNDTLETISSLNMLSEITSTTDLATTNPNGSFTNSLLFGPIDVDKTSMGPNFTMQPSSNKDMSERFLDFVSTVPPDLISTSHFSPLSLDNDTEMYSVDTGIYTPAPLIVTTYSRMVFGFIIPLAVILACYMCILCRVRGTHFSKSKQKMQSLILIIVSAFFICWAPYHIMGVFLLYSKSSTLMFFDHLSQCLAYVNSCINPMLYVFTGQDFKDKVRKSVRAILESAFTDDITRSTAPTKSRNSTDKNWSKSSQV